MERSSYAIVTLFLMIGAVPDAAGSSAFSCVTFQYGSASETSMTGINNKGQVVGWYSDASLHAFLRTPDGSATTLTSPTGSDDFIPVGINNWGQIAGPLFIIKPDGSYTQIPPAVPPQGHTYQSTEISGINDRGELTGTIIADNDGSGTPMNLVFIRTTDGNYHIIDQSGFGNPYPTLIPGRINNARVVVEHMRYSDGNLLKPDGSRVPLVYPGLEYETSVPGGSSFTAGLNNFNVTAGYTTSMIAPNLAFIHPPGQGFQEVICPAAGNASLSVRAINDKGVVAGDYFGSLPSGGNGRLGFIATPTGVLPHPVLSTRNWKFGPLPIGQSSAVARFYALNLGPADLNLAAVYIGLTGQTTDRTSTFRITHSNCAPVPDGPPSISPLPPGGVCFVDVQFTPQVEGVHTAALFIPNDSHASPLVVQLTGTGQPN